MRLGLYIISTYLALVALVATCEALGRFLFPTRAHVRRLRRMPKLEIPRNRLFRVGGRR